MPRHFLTLADLSAAEIETLIARAMHLKQAFQRRQLQQTCAGRVLALIFEKSSTRTRVSFETAMAHLGGHSVFLSPRDSQLGRGEPIEDTARVLSKMVDAVMIRTFEHERITRFAEHASVPVINGLSDSYHPCQLLADLQTYYELKGPIKGKKVAWFGDGNNMCNSWINAARIMDFHLHVAGPVACHPSADMVRQGGANLSLGEDPLAAAAASDLIVTDTWYSMRQEAEAEDKQDLFRPFQVNERLMTSAAPDAIFMHCLPAYRGAEVSAEVIDGSRSVVWEEAGNRLHAQKALLEFLLEGMG
ncbi:MAG: ornithine carbamoyltransferase [Gammaproteobacteria bacterium]|nr:ornithine carbamoyltransferase [Gammaproteobacteria bacterium]MCY4210741.1 ornithine carbamoyltransferase [Gammaproteobacteria bacterium]MCY4282093.1 ornithine carbamoyltransferase [Gammaproteobacteria bacterium]MCY4339656.1 ornithine carbamoyltransferase [Gammaproteobacteria bacterium]